MPEEPGKNSQEPDLELPSLRGFGRRRRQRKEALAEEPVAPIEAADEVETTAQPVLEEAIPDEPGDQELVHEEPVTLDEPDATQVIPAVPPVEAPVAEDVPPPLAADPVEPPPAPVDEDGAEDDPTPDESHPGPDFVAPAADTAVVPGPTPALVGEEPADEAPEEAAPAARERTPLTLPTINARLATAVTGLVVGLVGVVLASGAGRGCEAVRGVGSCGGIGLLALLGVLAVEIVLGGILLRAFQVTDPASTSFLGVGLMAVVALLFFLGSLESPWMFVVIPVLTGLTFLTSLWVTETFVAQTGDARR